MLLNFTTEGSDRDLSAESVNWLAQLEKPQLRKTTESCTEAAPELPLSVQTSDITMRHVTNDKNKAITG